VKSHPYSALSALTITTAAHAEGIALGNPLAGSSFAGLFGLPIFGSVSLRIAMALVRGLRKALCVALLLRALFAGTLALIGAGGTSNGTAVFWLAGLVLSPWICFGIITIRFISRVCSKSQNPRLMSAMPNPSIERTSSGKPGAASQVKS
jgi:hypothetical protein